MIRGVLHYPRHIEPNCKEYTDTLGHIQLSGLVPAEKAEMDVVGTDTCIGWWKAELKGPGDMYGGIVFLDRNSYILEDGGTKYGYEDFHRLAMEIRNQETEQALEAL